VVRADQEVEDDELVDRQGERDERRGDAGAMMSANGDLAEL
jgi:hypothetical protein